MKLKLNLGFLTIFTLLWVVCFFTLLSTMKVQQSFFELGRDTIPHAFAMNEMETRAFEIANEVKEYLAHGKDENRQNVRAIVKSLIKSGEGNLAYAKKRGRKEAAAATELLKKMRALYLDIANILALKTKGAAVDQLFKLEVKIHASFEPLIELISKLKEARMREMALTGNEVLEKHNKMIRNVKIIGITATLLSLIVVLLLDRLFIRYTRAREETVKVLHESEQRLSATLNSIGDAVISADRNGRVTDMNTEAERLTGWKVKEKMGSSLSEVFNMVDVTTGEPLESPTERVLRDKVIVELDKNAFLTAKDSTRHQISGSGTPLFDDDGLVRGVALHFWDVTGEIEVLQALQENESRFRLITFSTYELIYDWDFRNNKFKWFGNVDEVLGFRPPTFVEWEEAIHPKDREAVIGAYQKILYEKSGTFDMKYKIKRKDGTWRTWIDRGGLILDEKGEPYKLVGACTDITEHKWTEKTLREKEYYFRSLLNNIDEDIIVIDPNQIITYVNDTFLSKSGLRREEVVGRNCFEILHDDEEPCGERGKECRILDVFETGRSCSCLHERREADGSVVWEDILLSPLKDVEGNVSRVIEIIRDVTDLVEERTSL
ncbi:MAG: PAS domain S-box protein [Candidatus Omnitrophica bacterium]|nr:PAS domain S-box protein [Candidatus Omnitrophota bacterium]